MARYVMSGTSVMGAVSNNTTLFTIQANFTGAANFTNAMRMTLRRLILGTEGASSFAQGPLEIIVSGLTQAYGTDSSGGSMVERIPVPQDSQARPWPWPKTTGSGVVLATAWATNFAPIPNTVPLIRRSSSVLNELNMVLDADTFTCTFSTQTTTTAKGGFMVQTVGNSNPTAGGLTVSWTAFIDVTNLA